MSPQSTPLRLSDFDYDLPPELIAQAPEQVRDRSRLLVLGRTSGNVEHRIFSELPQFLREGDLLVLNDTKVFPCRLRARKQGGGHAEIFLLEEEAPNVWRALVKGGVRQGAQVGIGGGLAAEIVALMEDGSRRVRFHGVEDIRTRLSAVGDVPLPPYIRREARSEDRERYQTVYAAAEGAVAAPTAGLHFTKDLLKALEEQGIGTATVTLHVGPGTFQPVRTELVAGHQMHAERFAISEASAEIITRAKASGRRIIAVGTTTVRVLETAAGTDGVRPGSGTTDLFILPGFAFRIVDGLITNFHLPRSTLIMLVAAFAGRERVLAAYRTAVRQRYRFYSYGDAMLVL